MIPATDGFTNGASEEITELPQPKTELQDEDADETSASTPWTSTYGLPDAEFEALLTCELKKSPLYDQYPEVFAVAPSIITKWRQMYRGKGQTIWKRLYSQDKVLKELIEAVPIIDAVQRLVVTTELKGNEKFTIIDLACGKGFLSMMLSYLLPSDKVEKCVLVDKQWPMHNVTPQPHHISWTHIYGSFKKVEDQSIPRYYDYWPIKLNTSKQDLKSNKEIRSMQQRYFTGQGTYNFGSCSSMWNVELKSRRSVQQQSQNKVLCLKPCCLPGMVHAKRNEIFYLGEHSFDSKLVCSAGKWKKNVWKGPSRSVTKEFFQRWADNLFLGIDDNDAKKIQKTIMVQHGGGYQNEFLFAERVPETASVWNALERRVGAGG
eukprot:g1967.t1 g1967   contig11:437649-438947(-)